MDKALKKALKINDDDENEILDDYEGMRG